MACQLPVDCLCDIFERLEDKADLRSCSLVNHLWCEASVPILWTDIQNYDTLIACLPDESKEILHKNAINLPAVALRSPSFNYVAFIKNLSIDEILEKVSRNLQLTSSRGTDTVMQEIFKMFMNHTCLKSLTVLDPIWCNYFCTSYIPNTPSIPSIDCPEAKDCFKNLSKLRCETHIGSEFFHQLSRSSHHIRSLHITVDDVIPSGLLDLISVQRNLKYLTMHVYHSTHSNNLMMEIVSSLTNPDDLIQLDLDIGYFNYISLAFLSQFSNLQQLSIAFDYHDEYFKHLQHVSFSQLRVLRFSRDIPNHRYLMRFLENNGRSLMGIHLGYSTSSLNLSIAKSCPNLKSLCTLFIDDGVETLKAVLNDCQRLESLETWCGDGYNLSEDQLLGVIANHSPPGFHELIIHLSCEVGLRPLELFAEGLESAFTSWANRIPRRSLSLIIIRKSNAVEINQENMRAIERFKTFGVVKKFEIV